MILFDIYSTCKLKFRKTRPFFRSKLYVQNLIVTQLLLFHLTILQNMPIKLIHRKTSKKRVTYIRSTPYSIH
uniref:Putative ovule protein n=1 Tax=Solanum chacoense TaxID=4108 RepID=A0A0V0HJN9_SOLCH